MFWLHLGAAGVAYPSLISRVLSAAAVTVYCFYPQNAVRYRLSDVFAYDGALLKKMMGIAIPNGIENGVHQLVKVALSGMVALFGTYQIAANGVAQSIWSLAAIMGLAMAPVYTTVIGQCMGARDIAAANFYFKKLNRITLVLSVLWNALIFAITPLIVRCCAISAESKQLVVYLVLINNIFNGLAYPYAGSLSNGLRAAGDIKFTMIVSVTLTVAARLLFSALFGMWLGWGVIGVAVGMSMDLVFRGAIFIGRYRSLSVAKMDAVFGDLTRNKSIKKGLRRSPFLCAVIHDGRLVRCYSRFKKSSSSICAIVKILFSVPFATSAWFGIITTCSPSEYFL